ncbi:MAG: SMP-30/gluconolactonase/LRE family protein [Limisphaerales bacterium]
MKAPPRIGLLGTLTLLLVGSAAGSDDYRLSSESTGRAPGAGVGRVEPFRFTDSRVFPGTGRDGWVYIPAQYDGARPAALMVFQDGHAYVSTNGQMRVPIVFDNLIAKGELPVTVGVFVNPGHRGDDAPPADGWGNRNHRSFEYDSLGDAYARFLIDELIPFVTNRWRLNLDSDPRRRAIGGMSSGGICAWTVAWERPDSFGKVLSHIGSFTDIRGGHVYPALIRKTARKPVRIFLQEGSNDLNNLHGNWPLANQAMASSLAFAGYDFRFDFGDGAHDGKHGGAILPDSLRWLWRPESPPPSPPARDNLAGDEVLSKVLPEGGRPGDWEMVGEGYAFTDAACGDAGGNFYFSDLPKGVLYRIPAAGSQPEICLDHGPKVSGMKFGVDGLLYACVQGQGTNNIKRIAAIDLTRGTVETVATEVNPNDLVVSKAGWIYFTDTGAGNVVRVPANARGLSRPPPVAGGIHQPNGIALSANQRQLWVSEFGGTNVWQFLLDEDGSLRGGERLAVLRTPGGKLDSGGDGAAIDAAGRIHVTSHLGIQVFDANGRPGAVFARPQDRGTVSCAFAGTDGGYLYVCSSDKVYRRPALATGGPASP